MSGPGTNYWQFGLWRNTKSLHITQIYIGHLLKEKEIYFYYEIYFRLLWKIFIALRVLALKTLQK